MLAAGAKTDKPMQFLSLYSLVFTIAFLNLALFSSVEATTSCRSGKRWPVEKRARHAEMVFHALAVENYPAIDVENPPEKGFRYTAQFWLISVYKGDQQLAKYLNLEETLTNGIYDIHDRRVNVTRFYRPNATSTPNCWKPVTSQKYYVIFAEMRDNHLAAKDDDTLGAYADWTEKNEQKAWRGVGWEQWSEWAACSASCGDGSQIRSRYCLLQDGCRGFNREKRSCNTFPCEGSVSPLDVDQSKLLQPSRAQWTRVPGRETAWRLRPNSYLWLPAAQLPFPPANFRRHFAILVTLRLDPKAKAEGTVFSLRSRRQQDSYLSVELGGTEAIKVVHSGRNGTQTILVPASLADGNWHYLALGIQDDSSVRSYVDCRWVSTDILRRNELDTPDDADLVIGYLFSGDLEQLVIVPDPRAVSQQCSATKQPSLDPLLEATRPRRPSAFVRKALLAGNQFPVVNSEVTEAPLKKIAPTIPPPPEPDSSSWQDLDTDLAEEGSGLHPESTDQYEVEWSEWSQCASARGLACGSGGGHQTRSSRCVDAGGWLELCLESGAERTQTRACPLPPCNSNTTSHNNGRCGDCLNGGVCTTAGAGSKRRPCRCPPGSGGWRCEHFSCHPRCLNGGSCVALNTCSCTALYQGTHCQTPICDPPCENGGQCVAPQQCLCPPATFGNYCQNFTCRGGCLNGGLCVGADLCECQNNSTGPRCADPVCDPPCENGATCAAGNICLCGPHTSGTRCHTKKCDYRPVQEPYTRGYRRLVKKRLQAKCETWTWKTCVRTLPEYQTVYKTYYRTVYKCVDQL